MFDYSWDSLQKNLQAGAVSNGSQNNYNDDRFWKISKDDNGTGIAVIRLLPDSVGESSKPFVKMFTHSCTFYGADGKARYYIQDSPETIGLQCPASEKWASLYNMGTADAKDAAKKYARKIKFVANILVIKDPATPANEGKVFLWEFGTKLMDKFIAAMNPTEQMRSIGTVPKQLFDPTAAGSSITLKIKKANGFFNYDDTEINTASAVFKDTEKAAAFITKNCIPLQEFLSPEHYKPYDELKRLLAYAETGVRNSQVAQPAQPAQPAQQSVVEDKPLTQAQPTPTAMASVEDDDDDLEFLKTLA